MVISGVPRTLCLLIILLFAMRYSATLETPSYFFEEDKGVDRNTGLDALDKNAIQVLNWIKTLGITLFQEKSACFKRTHNKLQFHIMLRIS